MKFNLNHAKSRKSWNFETGTGKSGKWNTSCPIINLVSRTNPNFNFVRLIFAEKQHFLWLLFNSLKWLQQKIIMEGKVNVICVTNYF